MELTTAAEASLVIGEEATNTGAEASTKTAAKIRKNDAQSWMNGFMKLTCLRTKIPADERPSNSYLSQ